MDIKAFGPETPMILSLRLREGGGWKVAHRKLPNWTEATKAAFVVMTRVPGLKASLAQGYWADWKDGAPPPKQCWAAIASSTEILSLWPEPYYAHYVERLKRGAAHPLPGDEHLFPSGVSETAN